MSLPRVLRENLFDLRASAETHVSGGLAAPARPSTREGAALAPRAVSHGVPDRTEAQRAFRTTRNLAASAAEDAVGGGAWDTLPFVMQWQWPRANWCWAAVAVSVDGYFHSGSSAWSQCQLASDLLGSGCCSDPGPCDIPYYLDTALSHLGRLHSVVADHASQSAVVSEISNRYPIGARVQWSGDGAHFVVVSGYSQAGDYVQVDDSIFGRSWPPYVELVSYYQSQGTWTHTYWTK